MALGTLLTGRDVDGYPVCLFCPADDTGESILKAVRQRMVWANMTLNFAVTYEAVEAALAEAN